MSDERKMCPILAMSRGTDAALCQRNRCEWWVDVPVGSDRPVHGNCSLTLLTKLALMVLPSGERREESQDIQADPSPKGEAPQ